MTDKRHVTPTPWNAETLKAWRLRMEMTKGRAAEALGLSPNGYAAYERGYVVIDDPHDTSFEVGQVRSSRPIPKHVVLACMAIESVGLEQSESLRSWLSKA